MVACLISRPLTTGKIVAAIALLGSVQSAIIGWSMENVLPLRAGDPSDCRVKPTGPAIVPDRDAVPEVKARRIGDRDLLFAKISVEGKQTKLAHRFAEHGLLALATDRDVRAKVERVVHQERRLLDLDGAAAQSRPRSRRPPEERDCRYRSDRRPAGRQ